jgi:hypothetical protein
LAGFPALKGYRKIYRLVKEREVLPSQTEISQCMEENDEDCLAPALRSAIESLIAEKKVPKNHLRLIKKKGAQEVRNERSFVSIEASYLCS